MQFKPAIKSITSINFVSSSSSPCVSVVPCMC